MSISKKRPIINLKTSLENIPVEWLRNVEPHVQRGAFLPCWVWTGATDGKGYPLMRVTDVVTGERETVMVHRYVARIFFDFPEYYYVRRTCRTKNCVNPAHIKVTKVHHTQG